MTHDKHQAGNTHSTEQFEFNASDWLEISKRHSTTATVKWCGKRKRQRKERKNTNKYKKGKQKTKTKHKKKQRII